MHRGNKKNNNKRLPEREKEEGRSAERLQEMTSRVGSGKKGRVQIKLPPCGSSWIEQSLLVKLFPVYSTFVDYKKGI